MNIPSKDPVALYKFSITDYSEISKMINSMKRFPSICEYPSVGTNTKYGRLATLGLTLNRDHYQRKVRCLRIMSEPYYRKWEDVEYDLSSFKRLSDPDQDVIADLLSIGISVFPKELPTFLHVVMFFRIQKFMADNYDLLVRGCWPYYSDEDDIVIYVDQDYAV